MIKKPFLGTLRKYENRRIEDNMFKYFVIRHTDEGSVQTFLNPLTKELGVENITEVFTFPVRWNKISFDTSDYVKTHYKIKFAEVELEAELHEIVVKRKLVEGSDIFEYSLGFMKPSSEDVTDNLMVEAYLDYKEENDAGKKVFKTFDVEIELTERKNDLPTDDVF